MDYLTTKFNRPSPRPNVVVRTRLFQQLDNALLMGSTLILVSAPPGFGKTTLVSTWAAQNDLPAAWLSLEEADNDIVRFWRYLTSALRLALPSLDASLNEFPHAAQAADLDLPIQDLLNHLDRAEQNFLLILDDYHVIENTSIHATLDNFINHLPQGGYVLLLTRADPSLHLPRRRVRGDLAEIRAADLRFTADEAAEFLQKSMALKLTPEDMQSLETRTEGWIAGLQLAAISLRKVEDRHAFIRAFHGDDRMVADYLVEEVLRNQPEDHQAFLLRTSILRQFNAALCNRLTDRTDSTRLLEQLEQENLFLIALDNQREWFRYHALFARLLQKKLELFAGPALIRELYQRASEESIRQGLLVEGVQYLFSANNEVGAAEVITRHAHELFALNELPTLMHWAERLPDSILADNPGLCLSFGWAAHATGNPEKTRHYIELVEAHSGCTVERFLSLPPVEQQALPARMLGCILEAVVMHARLVIDQGIDSETLERFGRVLPWLVQERDSEPFANNSPSAMRPIMTFQMGMGQHLLGNVDAAETAFVETVELSRRLENHFLVALGLGYLGQVRAVQGKLNQAAETWREALAYAQEIGADRNAFFGLATVGLGSLAYEHNDLAAAGRYLDDGIQLARSWPAWQGLVPGYTTLAQVKQAGGDHPAAMQALNELQRFSASAPAMILPALNACRSLLLIRAGRADQAVEWLETVKPQNFDQMLTRVEGYIATKKLAQAKIVLDRVIFEAEKSNQNAHLIRGLALRAVILNAEDRPDAARSAIEKALLLAEEEGYARTFIDLGRPVETLIKRVTRPELEAYCVQLLAAFPRTESPDEIAVEQANARLTEPLTGRELEILRCIAETKDNEEISTALFISIYTVKKHITHLFAKLGAENRLQAVEKARSLGLLP